jgi:ribonuclease I
MRASTKVVFGLFLAVAMTNLILAQSEVEYEVEKFLGARIASKNQPSSNKQTVYEDYDTYVLSIQWGSKKKHF